MRAPQCQQLGCNRQHPKALAVLMLLSYCIATVGATPTMVNERSGNVLTLILADCSKYQTWLSVAAAFAWKQSGQPGSVVRVANCAAHEADDPGSLKTAQYVNTFIAPPYSWYEPLKDYYPPYNKPAAVMEYLARNDPKEDWVVILDSDMLVKDPFLPEELHLNRGWAYAADYYYLEGVSNNLALRILPEIAPRTDTLGGPKGRRADMAGAPYYMHKNDLRGMAPQWLKYTYIVRGDPQAYIDTLPWQLNSTRRERLWVAEMYGYSFGAAKSNVWHSLRDDFVKYPGQPARDPPKVIHAGLLIEAGDWQFQKHWYQDFDVQQCPPWNLTVNRPNAGIFAPPPHPDKQPNKDAQRRHADLLSAWTVATMNAGLCDYHARNCPPSQQLSEVCDQAFKLYHDIDKVLRDYEWSVPCLDTSDECAEWARRGKCIENKGYMEERCRLSCNICISKHGPRPTPTHKLIPLTVAAIQAEAWHTSPPMKSPPSDPLQPFAGVPRPHIKHPQRQLLSSRKGPTTRPSTPSLQMDFPITKALALPAFPTAVPVTSKLAPYHTPSAVGRVGVARHMSSVPYNTLIRSPASAVMDASTPQLLLAVLVSEQDGLSDELLSTARSVICWADALLLVSRTSTDSAEQSLGHAASQRACGAAGFPKRTTTLFTTVQHGVVYNGSVADARNAALVFTAQQQYQWALLLHEGEFISLHRGSQEVRALLLSSRADVLHCFRAFDAPVTQPCFLRMPALGYYAGLVEVIYVDPSKRFCSDVLVHNSSRRGRAAATAAAGAAAATATTAAQAAVPNVNASLWENQHVADRPGCSSVLPAVSIMQSSHVRRGVVETRAHTIREHLLNTTEASQRSYLWDALGDALMKLQEYPDAAWAYELAARQATSGDMSDWCYYKAAQAYAYGGHIAVGLAAAEKGVDLCSLRQVPPCRPELLWAASLHAYHMHKYQAAVDYGQNAVAAGCNLAAARSKHRSCPAATHPQHIHVPAWYELPWDVLRFAYRALGNISAANTAQASFSAAWAARANGFQPLEPVMSVYHVETVPGMSGLDNQDSVVQHQVPLHGFPEPWLEQVAKSSPQSFIMEEVLRSIMESSAPQKGPSLDRILFVVMGSRDKQERIQYLEDGWLEWVPPQNIILLVDEHIPGYNTTVLPPLDVDTYVQAKFGYAYAHNYTAANLRHLKSIYWLGNSKAVDLSGFDWVFLVDDDTFVNVPLLLSFLKPFSPSVPTLFARMVSNGHWAEHLANLTFPYGGAGMLFSKIGFQMLAARMLTPHCRFWRPINDITIGACTHVSGVLKVHSMLFVQEAMELSESDPKCPFLSDAGMKVTVHRVVEQQQAATYTCLVADRFDWPHTHCANITVNCGRACY